MLELEEDSLTDNSNSSITFECALLNSHYNEFVGHDQAQD